MIDDFISNTAQHLRACFTADKLHDAWGMDVKTVIRSRCDELSTRELRIAFETYCGEKMHPAAQREQIVETIAQHLKHFIIGNIDPRTNRAIAL